MDRITLSAEDETFLNSERSNAGVNPGDAIVAGTNLVVDDHLEVDGSWQCVVVGGASGDAPVIFVPSWGQFTFACDLIPYVSDRAGPNGQTMPIVESANPQVTP